ncbi:unnamed protein product, partial [Acanthoscelides obtectus]
EAGSLSAIVYADDVTSGLKDSTRLHVNVLPICAKDCNKMVEEVCFWTDAKYQIEEDVERDVVLGSLSSAYLMELCSIFKVTYTVSEKSWSLGLRAINNGNKEHAHPSTEITCSIEDVAGKLNGSKWEINKDIDVSVLDVNNCPPKPQYPELNIRMPRMDFKQGQEIPLPSVMFTDEDSLAVNNYATTIQGDAGNFLQPICRLKFTQDKVFPSGKFSFSVQLNDTTFRGKGISQAVSLP